LPPEYSNRYANGLHWLPWDNEPKFLSFRLPKGWNESKVLDDWLVVPPDNRTASGMIYTSQSATASVRSKGRDSVELCRLNFVVMLVLKVYITTRNTHGK
jgi:hypothetical protein